MKIGLSVRIDVSKIDKERLYKGEKGTYLDLSTYIDMDNKDQYGNNGFISQSTSKEEREAGVRTPILGNVRVYHVDGGNQPVQKPVQQAAPQPAQQESFDDDIPF